MSLNFKILLYEFKTFLKKFRKFNSINNIDKKMLDYINFKDGFFIECGANNGIDQSNTWHFEKFLNWKGVLIEPLPQKFYELKKNRNGKNFFFNCALVDKKEKNDLRIYEKNLQSKIVSENDIEYSDSVKVKSLTLTEILDRIESPQEIDFFSLDVEGFEYEVLRGNDFSKYNFRFLLIEIKNKKNKAKTDELINFLIGKNYRFIKYLSKYDYLFEYLK